jgi:hypothetical protein
MLKGKERSEVQTETEGGVDKWMPGFPPSTSLWSQSRESGHNDATGRTMLDLEIIHEKAFGKEGQICACVVNQDRLFLCT